MNHSFETIFKENKKKAGIYSFKSKYSLNFYVGSSIDLPKRFLQHYHNRGSNILLQKSFKKYRTINFYFYVLEYTKAIKEILLKTKEKYMSILELKYNIYFIPGFPLGIKHSIETRKKLSVTQIEKVLSQSSKEKLNAVKLDNKHFIYGKIHLDKTKQKISVARKGKKGFFS